MAEAASSVPYPYESLDEHQFRVLELQPGEYSEEICCSLKISSWSDADTVPYEALSYTWGVVSEGHSISLDKSSVIVTDNLWYGLRRLRRRNHARSLWVDALCINQADFDERGRQVRMMYELYSNATSGIVWLGESQRARDSSGAAFHSVNSQDFDAVDDLTYMQQCQELDRALALTQPLWSDRVWTIQEAAASKDLAIVFGRCEMPWQRFSDDFITNTAGYFQLDQSKLIEQSGVNEWIPHERRTAISLKFMEHMLIREQRATGTISLSNLASLTMTFHATDPRDKVNGLLGLMHTESANLIPVDYHKTNGDVFATATYSAITNERSLSIWQSVLPTEANDLPSWAVDFTTAQTHQNYMMATIRQQELFHKTGSLFFPDAVGPFMSDDLKRLKMRGLMLDRIDSHWSFPQEDLYRNVLHLPRPIVQAIWNATRSIPSKALRESRFNVLQDTLPPQHLAAQVTVLPEPVSVDTCLKRGCQLWAECAKLQQAL